MYASFGQAADYQTLPVDTEVVVPTGTPLFVVQRAADADGTDPVAVARRRAVMQDTFTVRLTEPVDVLFAEEAPLAPMPTPTVVEVAKSETESAWYKSPAFVGGVLSVLAFSVIAYLQSRAESKLK